MLRNNGAGLMDSAQGTTAFPFSGLLPATEEEMSPRNSPTLVNSSSSTGVWGCASAPLPEWWLLSSASLHTGLLGMDILDYFLVMIARRDWKERRRRVGGGIAL